MEQLPPYKVVDDRRQRILDSTRGLGPHLDQLLADERDRP